MIVNTRLQIKIPGLQISFEKGCRNTEFQVLINNLNPMKKKDIVLLHVLFWALMINLFVVASLPKVPINSAEELPKVFVEVLTKMGTTMAFFYASYFTLNFFLRKPKRFIWIAAVYLFTILLVFYGYNRVHMSSVPVFWKFVLALCSVSVPFSIVVFGFFFRLVIQGIQAGQRNRQLEKEKIATQLELLKSQINPHFLFNTLNNIDILIMEDPGRASQFLNKLSDILRFSLYDTRQETVPVEAEIENIQKYIDLQKIRTQNPSFAKLTVEGDAAGLSIAPMTFLPFIENAFKHSTNKKIENAVVIDIVAGKQAFHFICKNHCAEVTKLDDNSSGLGMNLIRSRFDLLYPNRYSLETARNGDWFVVKLKIQLNDH
jgi:two-component system, LytTR family, sensor kinase